MQLVNHAPTQGTLGIQDATSFAAATASIHALPPHGAPRPRPHAAHRLQRHRHSRPQAHARLDHRHARQRPRTRRHRAGGNLKLSSRQDQRAYPPPGEARKRRAARRCTGRGGSRAAQHPRRASRSQRKNGPQYPRPFSPVQPAPNRQSPRGHTRCCRHTGDHRKVGRRQSHFLPGHHTLRHLPSGQRPRQGIWSGPLAHWRPRQ